VKNSRRLLVVSIAVSALCMLPCAQPAAARRACSLVPLSSMTAAQTAPLRCVTRQSVSIGGQEVRYRALVERFIEDDAAGAPALSLVVTSYLRDEATDAARWRPVIFLFNGGPSDSSSGLHMELGPLQPEPASRDGQRAAARFIDNPDSLLDVADLVFFDPAETGFSRMLPGGVRAHDYSLEGDADSLARLVIAWVHRHGRERSPLYLLGESYGSIRAVVTARKLQKALRVSGLILFGNSLPIRETSDGIVGAATALPMEAMAASYHGLVSSHGLSPERFLDAAYDFAIDRYLPALAQGNALPPRHARQIAAEVSAFTGIPAGYYLAHHLVAPRPLASDTRALQPAALDPAERPPTTGSRPRRARRPSEPPSVLGEYLRTVLHVRSRGLRYREFAPDSFKTWDYGSGCDGWMRAKELCNPSQRTVFSDYDWPGMLLELFATQPRFRAMIVAGYYDGLSSIGQTRFMLAQHGYPRDRLEYREYASGHATAADPKARAEVARDIRAFVRAGMTADAPAPGSAIVSPARGHEKSK
jgi:Serine carboxypeptidase